MKCPKCKKDGLLQFLRGGSIYGLYCVYRCYFCKFSISETDCKDGEKRSVKNELAKKKKLKKQVEKVLGNGKQKK